MIMNAEGIREIAKMQCSIDGYSCFLNNLYLKLIYPNKEIACVSSGNDISEAIWQEVEKLQNRLKDYERKASTTD
jgi:hypothetical protein